MKWNWTSNGYSHQTPAVKRHKNQKTNLLCCGTEHVLVHAIVLPYVALCSLYYKVYRYKRRTLLNPNGFFSMNENLIPEKKNHFSMFGKLSSNWKFKQSNWSQHIFLHLIWMLDTCSSPVCPYRKPWKPKQISIALHVDSYALIVYKRLIYWQRRDTLRQLSLLSRWKF